MSRLLLSDSVKGGLHGEPGLVLDKKLGDTALPALASSRRQDRQLVSFNKSGSSLKDRVCNVSTLCLEVSLADDRPELVDKVVIGHSIAVADFADAYGLQDAASTKLFLDCHFVHVGGLGRCQAVRFYATHVPRDRIVDCVDQLGKLLLELS